MEKVKFNGNGFEYFKIWIVNILLTLITFTIYYPWAKVRKNRYLYANTQIGEHSFEYHATGKQLLPGYLLSLALLVIYIVLQQLFPLASMFILLILFIGFPWIIWKSLQFNLRMTSFANVRFSFQGSLGDSYFNFMVLLILSVIIFYAAFGIPILISAVLLGSSSTLGSIISFITFVGFAILSLYIYAYKQKRNNEYLFGQRKFGNGQFITSLDTKPFIKILLKTALLTIAAYIICVIAMLAVVLGAGFSEFEELQGKLNNPEEIFAELSAFAGLFIALYFIMVAAGLFIAAYLQARIRHYLYANTSIDSTINFASSLTARKLMWVMFSNFLLIIFTLGLATPWAKVRMIRTLAENTYVDTDSDLSQYISERQEESTSLGEQIGDAFDVDVGITI